MEAFSSVNEVANFFIVKACSGDTPEPVTHLKLQKLVYYAQAWSVALDGKALVREEFEAWPHGPVCRELYDRFKGNGWKPITLEVAGLDADYVPQIGADEAELLEDVWGRYGLYTAKALENLTHNEAPWIEARGDISKIARSSEVISLDAMRSYYSSILSEK